MTSPILAVVGGMATPLLKQRPGPIGMAASTLRTPRRSKMFRDAGRFPDSLGPVTALRLKALD